MLRSDISGDAASKSFCERRFGGNILILISIDLLFLFDFVVVFTVCFR